MSKVNIIPNLGKRLNLIAIMKKAKFWFKNEKEVMKKLGFEPVKGSGSGWIHKEDGESEFALAQLKSTEAESYKLNYLDIQKLEYHASVSHKLPVFVIEFLNRGTYFLVNTNDLDKLNCLVRGKSDGREKDDMVATLDIFDAMGSDRVDTRKNVKVKSSRQERERFFKEREKQWKSKRR